MGSIIWLNQRHYCVCSTEDTFAQDFPEILKRMLQNFKKVYIFIGISAQWRGNIYISLKSVVNIVK